MQIPLEQFEQYIDETILKRGLFYFKKRRVSQVEEISSGEYEAIVDGILKYLEFNMGRDHYQKACRYLQRMIKLGGKEKANEVIFFLRNTYPQKKALI